MSSSGQRPQHGPLGCSSTTALNPVNQFIVGDIRSTIYDIKDPVNNTPYTVILDIPLCECARRCEETNGVCDYMAYIPDTPALPGIHCYLKTSVGPVTRKHNIWFPDSLSPLRPDGSTDIYTNNVGQMVPGISEQECKSRCFDGDLQGCMFVVYIPAETGANDSECWPKQTENQNTGVIVGYAAGQAPMTASKVVVVPTPTTTTTTTSSSSSSSPPMDHLTSASDTNRQNGSSTVSSSTMWFGGSLPGGTSNNDGSGGDISVAPIKKPVITSVTMASNDSSVGSSSAASAETHGALSALIIVAIALSSLAVICAISAVAAFLIIRRRRNAQRDKPSVDLANPFHVPYSYTSAPIAAAVTENAFQAPIVAAVTDNAFKPSEHSHRNEYAAEGSQAAVFSKEKSVPLQDPSSVEPPSYSDLDMTPVKITFKSYGDKNS